MRPRHKIPFILSQTGLGSWSLAANPPPPSREDYITNSYKIGPRLSYIGKDAIYTFWPMRALAPALPSQCVEGGSYKFWPGGGGGTFVNLSTQTLSLKQTCGFTTVHTTYIAEVYYDRQWLIAKQKLLHMIGDRRNHIIIVRSPRAKKTKDILTSTRENCEDMYCTVHISRWKRT